MKKLKAIIMAAAIALLPATMAAQQPETIVDKIKSAGNCELHQPDGMNARLFVTEEAVDTVSDEDLANARRMAGYRIQVFSDNNYRTAKNEANAKARVFSERFPEMRTYVVYNSPFWRLRVGDFRSQDEALEKVVEIKEAFPQYSREIRVVRDRINYVEK